MRDRAVRTLANMRNLASFQTIWSMGLASLSWSLRDDSAGSWTEKLLPSTVLLGAYRRILATRQRS